MKNNEFFTEFSDLRAKKRSSVCKIIEVAPLLQIFHCVRKKSSFVSKILGVRPPLPPKKTDALDSPLITWSEIWVTIVFLNSVHYQENKLFCFDQQIGFNGVWFRFHSTSLIETEFCLLGDILLCHSPPT